MSTVMTLRVPLALWRACATRADQAGIPTTTWILAAITKAAR